MSGLGVPFTDSDQALLNVSSSIDGIPRDWLNAFSKQSLPFMEWMKSYLGFTIESTSFGFQRVISTEKCPGKYSVRNSYWYLWMVGDGDAVLACPHCWSVMPDHSKKDYSRLFSRRAQLCSIAITDVLEVSPCKHSYPYDGPGMGLCQVCHEAITKGKYCLTCAANVKLCPCGRKNKEKKKGTQQ